MPNLIPKINDQNEIIGETTITEAKQNGWPRRVARIFIFDEDNNQVLLQKRSESAFAHPGFWDMAGGHVDVGESYEQAGKREVKEELGISVDLTEIAGPERNRSSFYVLFKATVHQSTAFKLSPDEVSEVRWVRVVDLDSELNEDNFAPWFVYTWNTHRDTLIAS